ncbi:MAG TPA: hypothetical protein VFU47_17990, partial [Armatimonadota bacterium]|nr:hypothetical protein [Armatimonadota bacterium]
MPERPTLVHSLMQFPRLGRHVKRTHDAWLRRRCEQYWQSDRSPARRRFARNPPVLTEVQARIISDLRAHGMAHAPYEELVGDAALWESMDAAIQEWVAGSAVQQKARAYIEGGYQSGVFKEYLVKLYGFNDRRVIPWDSPFLRMGVHPRLLDVVNSYLGMQSILRYLDAWYTIPLNKERPLTGSQCWHRDPEDVRIAKVFLYFSDVDLSAGALEYIPDSRAGDRYGHLWPHRVPSGSRAPLEGVAAAIPPEDIRVCAHPRGTFLFVDTTGLHRGGRALDRARVFACW